MLNQRMALFPLRLHGMVEITPRLRHRQRPDNLADSHQNKPNNQQRLDARDRGREPRIAIRVEGVRDDALDDRRAVGNVIRPAVGGEEEGGDGCDVGVVSSGGVEFEEVEERQRGEEARHAP